MFLLQELGKKLFKRRRVLTKQKRKKHRIVGAVVDEGLITKHHLKKRRLVKDTKGDQMNSVCCMSSRAGLKSLNKLSVKGRN